MAWRMAYDLVIPGEAVPQGRPRFGHGRTYDPPKSRKYKVCAEISKKEYAVRRAERAVDMPRALDVCNLSRRAKIVEPRVYVRLDREVDDGQE